MPFETEIEITYDVAKGAALTHYRSQKKKWIALIILIALLIILGLFLLIYYDDKLIGALGVIMGIIYIPLIFLIWNIRLKKAYESNKAFKDTKIHMTFWEEELELKTAKTESRIRYDALYSVLEDDKYILLCPSSKQYFVVKKANCSEELITFLHGKAAEINSRR